MSLNDTPRASRLHIGIYGRRNAGKSSLINALTGQDIALVSDAPGTTTDPIYKSMELHPVGPVVFIDTAGFDDEGVLGKLRVERTAGVVDKTDVGIIVIDNEALGKAAAAGSPGAYGPGGAAAAAHAPAAVSVDEMLAEEKLWAEKLTEKNVPLIFVLNKCDEMQAPAAAEPVDAAADEIARAVEALAGKWPVIKTSALHKTGMTELRKAIEQAVPEDFLREKILGDMVEEGGLVLLVMPQDIQAPKGRLILPQVQTLRELLDRKCTAVAAAADGFERALSAMNRAPDLIITDSQCFAQVYDKKPAESALTSFSVLFAAYKGDIGKFIAGASILDDMTEKSRVLIAEACTHVPLSEDIGRVKIPRLLRKRIGSELEVVNVCGNDFPGTEELKGFDLIIHCGACMFNRKHVLSRIAAAEAAGVPITNYGVVLAKLTGILDKIEVPG